MKSKLKAVGASEVRNNFAEIINEAHYTNQPIIVKKTRKPFAVILSYEEYVSLLKERENRFKVLDRIRNKNSNKINLKELESDIKEAINQ